MEVPAKPLRDPPPPVAPDWALFLDVDGTLVDFADHPDDVVVPPSLPATLAALGQVLSGHLALISGRPIASLDRLFPGFPHAVSGLHGGETRINRRAPIAQAVPPAWLERMRQQLRALAAPWSGVWLEDKGLCIAVHYRLAPEAEPVLTEHIARMVAPHLDIVDVISGKYVFEVRPRGIDKGASIQYFMGLPTWRTRVAVFAGDDRTDEDGFAAVHALRGISVGVGDRPTLTNFHLPRPVDVLAWLQNSLARFPVVAEPPG